MDQVKPLDKQPEQLEQRLKAEQAARDAGKRIEHAQDVTPKPKEIDARTMAKHDANLNGLMEQELDWKTGEKIAANVLEKEGQKRGGRIETQDGFVSGQFDGVHGIDLVGATKDGRPMIVEVKETQSQAKLKDDPLKSMQGTQYEKPVLQDGKWVVPEGDGSLSDVKQMGDDWVKNRWVRLISDDSKREELFAAGVKNKYLNPHNFTEDTHLWDDILGNRKVAVVSPNGADAVGDTLVNQTQDPHRRAEIIPIRV